ncbi:MAG: hypothetical protein R6U40_09520 [Desulfobacterales bacterium]
MNSQKGVTPAKAGVQMLCNCLKILDSGFRRNDGLRLGEKTVFYDFLRIHHYWSPRFPP